MLAGSLLFVFFPGPAFAIENLDCLECHGDLMLKQPLAAGNLRSMYVDPAGWKGDAHNKKGIKCVDCHEGMTPFLHPKEGARKVECARCHPEACEEDQYNLHNGFTGISSKALPECYDCHSKHRVRAKNDLESTINGRNIGETCCSCHEDKMVRGLLACLPTYTIFSHRKCDMNEKLDLRRCINCHGDAGHGPLSGYPEYCARCHTTKKLVGFPSATHRATSFSDHPFRFIMDRLGLILNLVIFIGVVTTLLIFLAHFHKKGKNHNL